MQANNTLSYYTMALDLYAVAKRDYPSASFWFTGHSLGGSVAAIVGHDVGCPVFGYEAPGELLYGKRLGLSINDRDMGAYRKPANRQPPNQKLKLKKKFFF